MKTESSVFCAMANRPLVLLTLILLPFAGSAWGQTTISLNNSGQQTFAFDPTNHFLYVAQQGTAGHNLNVINTLTNIVVGSTTFAGSSYASQVAASGTTVFWASQSDNTVQVFSVNGSGVPALTRTDTPINLATGIAALSTTYAVSKQGTGDFIEIRNLAGGLLFNVPLSGVAGQVFADSNTNRYYARSTNSDKAIDAVTGSIIGTLNGIVLAVDSSAAHNFVYMQDGVTTTQLDQLNGTSNTQTTFYNFSAAFSDVAVNSANGDVFVALPSLNLVDHFNSSLTLLGQYTVAGAQSLAFADGNLYVDVTGQNFLTVIAIPEPATWSVLLVGLGLVSAILRRRVKAVPLGAR